MRRPSPSSLFFILSLLCFGGAALAEYGMRPPLTFRPDDRVLSFGNTAASPDVSISWETTGAEDHLSAVIASGAGLLVSSDADVDRSGSIASGATYLGVCSDDATAPTECVVSWHDGTNGILSTFSGDLVFQPNSAIVSLAASDAVTPITQIQGSTRPSIQLREAAGAGLVLTHGTDFDQSTIGVASVSGYHVNLTDVANVALDHDHATQVNPTLYLHSVTSPDTDNTQWGSLAFIAATDRFDIDSGSNVISLLGASQGRFTFTGSTTTRPQMRIFAGNAQVVMLGAQSVHAQNTLAIDDVGGNQLVICNTVSEASDAGHATTTNPTLFIHSDQDTGGAGAAEWGSLSHDQTDFVISTGEGNVNFTPAGEFIVIDPGTNSAVYKGDVTEVQTTDATQTTCTSLTIATDQIVHLRAMVVGIVATTGANLASYEMVGTFHNVAGGGATQVGSTTSVHLAETAGASAWAADYTLAAGIVRTSVTGAASTTINWACSLEYLDR